MDMSGESADIAEQQEDFSPRAAARAPDLSLLDWTALILVVAGGLNCGLMAAVNLDVFARVFPHAVARGIQGLIGLAALHCVVMLFRWGGEPA